MRSQFGWDLPPGVRTSDLPGNRPEDQLAEAAAESLYTGLYEATRAGFSVSEIMEEWRMAAEQAFIDETEEAEAEARAEADMAADAEEMWASADRDEGPVDFGSSEEARQRWAERYDELNGAPEGDHDR